MFIIMFIGAFIKRAGLITTEETKKFNRIVFITCFGPLMFDTLYGKELGDAVDLRLIVFTAATVLVLYALTVVFVLKIEKNQKTRGAMIQAIYRSNFVI
ncbi:MAG: AEC family transporter, partial [Firmicutes bacterium]|nr:AEC family transporter [Bacillota bacterium]